VVVDHREQLRRRHGSEVGVNEAHGSLEAIEDRPCNPNWPHGDVEIGQLSAHNITVGESGRRPVDSFFYGIR